MLVQNETVSTNLRRYKITPQFTDHAVTALEISDREITFCYLRISYWAKIVNLTVSKTRALNCGTQCWLRVF